MAEKQTIQDRLEYLRSQIHAECISHGEIAELQSLAEHIKPGDVELLEWAGVPEFPEDLPEKFTLSITLGNAAMQTPDQVAQALRKVADKLTDRGDFDGPEGALSHGSIRDYNGNTVGSWSAA